MVFFFPDFSPDSVQTLRESAFLFEVCCQTCDLTSQKIRLLVDQAQHHIPRNFGFT